MSRLGRRRRALPPALRRPTGAGSAGEPGPTPLPRLDANPGTDDLAEAVTALVESVAANWSGPSAPPVRLLPALVDAADLPAPATPSAVPIGLAEQDLQPVHLDLVNEAHLLLLGDVGSGKSSFLRGVARSITRAFTPEQARIILIDYRRSLLGCVDTEHLIGYVTGEATAVDVLADVCAALRERLPDPEVPPQQPSERRWRGPDLYLLVDDYDLVATDANPLASLLEYLGHARDIGLHVIITRGTAGAARALYEPFLARVRELTTARILLSGSPAEGALLFQQRPQPQPPGRGWLMTRRDGLRVVQLAWTPPAR